NLLWTREQLTDEDRQWLRHLPYVRQLSGFTIVHGILDESARSGYVFDKMAAANHFQFQNTSVCFFAHTHVPVAFTRDTVVRGGTYSTLRVEPGRMYFVDIASVGQSRDIKNKATYVIYDLEQRAIELRR